MDLNIVKGSLATSLDMPIDTEIEEDEMVQALMNEVAAIPSYHAALIDARKDLTELQERFLDKSHELEAAKKTLVYMIMSAELGDLIKATNAKIIEYCGIKIDWARDKMIFPKRPTIEKGQA